jgi:hypothetical protein
MEPHRGRCLFLSDNFDHTQQLVKGYEKNTGLAEAVECIRTQAFDRLGVSNLNWE